VWKQVKDKKGIKERVKITKILEEKGRKIEGNV
jgi:hypothetical protein